MKTTAIGGLAFAGKVKTKLGSNLLPRGGQHLLPLWRVDILNRV
jgi:hypothetical protein